MSDLSASSMSMKGVKADFKKLEEHRTQLQAEVDKNLVRFRFMIADPDFNVNSLAQKLDLIYGVLGCRPRNARGRPLGKDSKLKPSAGALALNQAKLEHRIVNHIIRAMEEVMASDKHMSKVTRPFGTQGQVNWMRVVWGMKGMGGI